MTAAIMRPSSTAWVKCLSVSRRCRRPQSWCWSWSAMRESTYCRARYPYRQSWSEARTAID